jgi:glycosyltransferase involved in cell wall biosynthesis
MTPKIKILETIRQGKIGGGETHVLDLIGNMDRSRFEPIVLSFTEGPMVDRVKALGVEVHVIYTEKAFNVGVWGKVKQFMIKHEVDIVHAHGTKANSNVFWAAKKLNLPIIYTVHGWSFHQDQNWFIKTIRVNSEKFLSDKANKTILVSYSNQKDGIDFFDMKRSQVVNHGIDASKYDPNCEFQDLRDELGLPENKTVVGFLVRLTKQKDPFTLIRAIAKVKIKTTDIVFLFMGNGDLLNASQKLAKDLDVEDMIVWSGFRQDMQNVLNTIDVYALPSLWEGLPIGLLEAMAMAIPVVATSVDGTKEAIRNGENGILVNCEDPDGLAKAILNLHNNATMRCDFGKKSREIILKTYGIDRMCREIEAVYLQHKQAYEKRIGELQPRNNLTVKK